MILRSLLLVALFYALLATSKSAIAAPATIDTSTTATATASSAQRKTFFDSLNNTHWAFYHNGTAIEYSYSADGEIWTSAGTLAYNTASFSVAYKSISGTSYVFVVAEANSFDIVLRRGALDATSITFDAEQTAFDGSGASDLFLKPTVALSENNHLWVASIKDIGAGKFERFQVSARRSTNLADGDLSALNQAFGIGQQVEHLKEAVVLPKNGDEMYILSSPGEALVGYIYDGTEWSNANTSEDYSWFGFGKNGVTGNVEAIAVSGTDVYVGGSFTDAGGNVAAGRIARWDTVNSTWNALGSGAGVAGGRVVTITISGTDIYVGGDFTNAGGLADADKIARWDTVTSTWHSLGTGFNGTVVNGIAVLGSDVYVGGQFSNATGIAEADNIIRWDTTNSTWNAIGNGLNSTVRTLVSSGTDVYIGGDFTDAGGIAAADKIVRFDTTNSSWNALGSGLNSVVYAIAISGTNIYLGGGFINAGGIAAADYVVRWNTSNSSWNALGVGLTGGVTSLGISGGDLYVGGSFQNAGGVAAADRIARWNGANWLALGNGISSGVGPIAVSGSDVFVGGSFFSVDSVANSRAIVRWNTLNSTWNALTSGTGGIDSHIYAITPFGADVYVGGGFTDAGGVSNADYIARWDGHAWNALGTGLNGGVSEILVSGTDLYIAGSFTDAGGIAEADRIVRWDTVNETWHALGSGISNGSVTAIAVSGTNIYLGGSFTDAGGVAAADNIVRWDTSNSSWNALGTGLIGSAYTIGIAGTDVYVGGFFSSAGGVANTVGIARWNTSNSSWNAMGTGVMGDYGEYAVHAIVVSGSDVYVGGDFNNIGDRLAIWNGASWSAVAHPYGYHVNEAINTIAISGSEIYIGGYWTFAKFDGSTWGQIGFGGGDISSTVYAVAVSGDVVYAGGSINQFPDKAQASYLAYYAPTIATDVDSTTEISAVSDANGDVYLSYTNDSDQVKFRRFDESDAAWDAAVTLNATAASSPSITYKNSDGRVTTSWVESNSVNFSHSLTPYEAADWITEDTIHSTGTNLGVTTAAHQETADLPVIWTNGVGNPYSIFASPIDMSAPSVVISSAATDPTNVSPIPVTITFSKDVTGFVIGDITVGNGTAGNFVSVNDSTYTADITPTADGAVTVDIAGSVALDAFANDNTAATQLTRTYDTEAPTVAISSSATNPTNSSPFSITIQFNETVTGFVIGDITVGNGTAGNFVAVDGDTYTADITPTADGAVTVDVAGSVAADGATNDNTAATQFSVTYDNTIPTVTITNINTPINLSNRSAFAVTGSCSENGRAVSLGATSSAGGAAVSTTANCNAGSWSKSLNLSGLNDGTVTVTADLDDAVGLDAVQASRTATKDTSAPTGAIATTSSNPTNVTPIPITIEFSEAVTGLLATDFTATNGYVTNLVALDSDSYTAHLVPSANGTVTAALGADKVEDLRDNGNTLSNQLSIVFDSTSPLVSLSSTVTSPTTEQTIPLKVQFSEDVSGFSKSDITVSNATISNFSATSATVYEMDLKPKAEGDITVNVAAGVAEDENGNGNLVATEYSITYSNRLICSVWNGFFSGEDQLVWNILEHVNLGSKSIGIKATLYSLEGEEKSSAEFSVEPGQQLDLLVHDMPGWIPDSYGLVCSKVVSGDSNDLDGRMVYYKRLPEGGFEYIFASPFTDGYAGNQYVGFNTYQPSLSTEDAADFVANWIEITNLDEEQQSGLLLFYDQGGALLLSKNITIKGKGQSDNSAHDWDGPTVGFVEWRPSSESARFIVKNTRYLYDNASLKSSFDGVFQLQASQGEKGVISAILDTAGASSILEVANIRDQAVQTRARFYSSEGELLAKLEFKLPKHGSQHIIADSILSDGTGSVLIDAPGATTESLTATVFQYGRVENGGIAYLYGVSAVKPAGETLHGSYNTFLNQSCDIYLANSSDTAQTATISMQRNNGNQVFSNNVITLDPKQSVVSNICAAESEESYGVVTLNAGNAGVINSYLLRKDINNSYRYPIPVR